MKRSGATYSPVTEGRPSLCYFAADGTASTVSALSSVPSNLFPMKPALSEGQTA